MRLREGRSIFQGGRDHSSHRLALLGLKKRRAVLVIYLICALLGISALMIQRLSLKSSVMMISFVALSMFSLGVRLAFINTGRYGRLKGASDAE